MCESLKVKKWTKCVNEINLIGGKRVLYCKKEKKKNENTMETSSLVFMYLEMKPMNTFLFCNIGYILRVRSQPV